MLYQDPPLNIFGDITNWHGLYTAILDNDPGQQCDGVSGCEDAFAKYCEKANTLACLGDNLCAELHTVTAKNIAGVNDSYFGELPKHWVTLWSWANFVVDLDALEISSPSAVGCIVFRWRSRHYCLCPICEAWCPSIVWLTTFHYGPVTNCFWCYWFCVLYWYNGLSDISYKSL